MPKAFKLILKFRYHCTTEYQCYVPQNTSQFDKYAEKIISPVNKTCIVWVSYVVIGLYCTRKGCIYKCFIHRTSTIKNNIFFNVFIYIINRLKVIVGFFYCFRTNNSRRNCSFLKFHD